MKVETYRNPHIKQARSVPEKVINGIARMYAYDLQTAYEKGLNDE